jgi:phosphatidylglycerophosphate synthase
MEQKAENRKRVAIILAPDDRGLRKVFGIPAVRRLTLAMRKLGLEEINIIGRVEALQPVLSDLLPPQRFLRVEGPGSLPRIAENLALSEQQRVLILKGNHVIDRPSLDRMIEMDNFSGPYFMGAKGKDTEGIYSATSPDLFSILQHLWSPSSSPRLPKAQPVKGADGLPYVLGGGEGETKIAEDKLMKALAEQTKGDDGFLARHLSRKVSRFMSRRLVLTPVTPNQITLGGSGIGMAGALFLAWGGYWHQLIGCLLFLLCIIVDGVDGEIARLKLQETPFGHTLDVIMDNIVHIAIFLGLALGLVRNSGDPVYWHILWVLLGGFALCGLAVYQCILKPSPDELRHSAKTIKIMALMSNRDFAYILAALALVGRLHWFFIGAAVGTYIFAATLWALRFYEKRVIAR